MSTIELVCRIGCGIAAVLLVVRYGVRWLRRRRAMSRAETVGRAFDRALATEASRRLPMKHTRWSR